MVRILTLSTLYPNPAQPVHGIFVENRLRHLLEAGQFEGCVVAPVAWSPLRRLRVANPAAVTGIPAREVRHGITVHHPRFLTIPKLGMTLAPTLLYQALRRAVPRLLAAEGDIDLIDAHYFYPDGVAAVMLGRLLDKPVVITARGSDISQIPRYALPRLQIQWAARHASGLIAVCQALKNALVGLGVEEHRVRVLPNGVDLLQFQPRPRAEARRRLGIDAPTLLSVGLLIPRKGHDLVIRSLAGLPGVGLMIAGEGPEKGVLERLARDVGVAERVRFFGLVAHADLAELYSAADALVLASSREGWANVLLEAMACGTPAIASDVWGNAEVVSEPAAGMLVARDADAIAAAVRRLLAAPPARQDTRRYAERFSWQSVTRGQIDLFREILSGRTRARVA
jgi:glycosyltransferase involved in cell wall biosynthesis